MVGRNYARNVEGAMPTTRKHRRQSDTRNAFAVREFVKRKVFKSSRESLFTFASQLTQSRVLFGGKKRIFIRFALIDLQFEQFYSVSASMQMRHGNAAYKIEYCWKLLAFHVVETFKCIWHCNQRIDVDGKVERGDEIKSQKITIGFNSNHITAALSLSLSFPGITSRCRYWPTATF